MIADQCEEEDSPVATIIQDAEIVEKVLREHARFYATPKKFRTLTAFDRERGLFLLLNEG